jgi:hypothetical protein
MIPKLKERHSGARLSFLFVHSGIWMGWQFHVMHEHESNPQPCRRVGAPLQIEQNESGWCPNLLNLGALCLLSKMFPRQLVVS